MKQSIKNIIYQGIVSNKWIDISYINSKKEETNYYIGIIDIDIKRDLIECDIFNPFKSNNVLLVDRKNIFIKLSGIKNAKVIDESYYDTPSDLINRINSDKELLSYLEVYKMDNNILCYLSDCYRLDNDPYIKEKYSFDDIDLHTLQEHFYYKLDDKQFNKILEDLFKKPKYEAERINRFRELGINVLSIFTNRKQYVVAYRSLTLNFKTKTLRVAKTSTINKSFLIEETKKVTLGMYLDMNPDEFCQNFDSNIENYKELLRDNFHNGEMIDTTPTIFFIERNSQKGVDLAFESIYELEKENKLTPPLKSFFGRNRSIRETSKNPNIVVFDRNKINIDQMRVIYNSMINHVTFVKGPPGTGKTETIFNVLLSAYANDKTVLVCSNNNHPVNDIFKKMSNSLFHKQAYTHQIETILFPIMRLGNNEETIETISRLKEIIDFANKHKDSTVTESKTEASKSKSLSGYEELRKLLVEYEERISLEEKVTSLEKIKLLAHISRLNESIDQQLKIQNSKIAESKEIQDDDVMKYAISASEDKDFQNYVYYSALARVKKLLLPTYKELRDILSIESMDEAVISFNKYLKDDKNLRRFLDVFPIIVCTNLSCEKLGTAKPHFDICIMDEAGQCNIASSLIPIVRGDNLLLVGDTNQLQPVTVIESTVNDSLMEKYNIKDDYNYIKNSILSTMLRKDTNSKSILLRYHYRCGKKIAAFVNSRFYEEQLKLLNNNEGKLTYINVKNTFNSDGRNSYKEEALSIAKLIKNNKYKDVGIITPFVNQAALINEYLVKLGITDVKAGTIHTLQGSEKSVIIMSAALSLKTGKKTMEWVKDNHELINVGVTRAKNNFIFVGDKEAIDLLSKNDKNDIKVLSDYVYSNGEIIVPKSDVSISTDFSNNSQSEKDFFATVSPYFNRRNSKFRITRNIQVSKAIKNIHPQDLITIGKKEFDVLVEVSSGVLNNRYRPIVVFEIDGGEHIGSKITAARDRAKEEICQRYGLKLIRIANNQVKDYELIINLFECISKNIKDIDEAYVQGSLFEE